MTEDKKTLLLDPKAKRAIRNDLAYIASCFRPWDDGRRCTRCGSWEGNGKILSYVVHPYSGDMAQRFEGKIAAPDEEMGL
jgi:hypothetical protein